MLVVVAAFRKLKKRTHKTIGFGAQKRKSVSRGSPLRISPKAMTFRVPRKRKLP